MFPFLPFVRFVLPVRRNWVLVARCLLFMLWNDTRLWRSCTVIVSYWSHRQGSQSFTLMKRLCVDHTHIYHMLIAWSCFSETWKDTDRCWRWCLHACWQWRLVYSWRTEQFILTLAFMVQNSVGTSQHLAHGYAWHLSRVVLSVQVSGASTR